MDVLGANCQLVKSAYGTVTYIRHTPAGTNAASPGSLTWKFRWIAPKTADSPVEFDLAANASNNDASPIDDSIYTATAVSRPK